MPVPISEPAVAVALLLAWLAVVSIGGLCLVYAVAADAGARGRSGLWWGVLALSLSVIAVPIYLLVRAYRYPPRESPPTRLERAAGTAAAGFFGAAAGAARLAPPDPFSTAVWTLGLIVVFVPLAYVVLYEPGVDRVVERAG